MRNESQTKSTGTTLANAPDGTLTHSQLGKWPRVLIVLRIYKCRLSTVFVV